MGAACHAPLCLLLCAAWAAPQQIELTPHVFPAAEGESVLGAAFAPAGAVGGTVYTWGGRVLTWSLPGGRAEVVVEGEMVFGPGGCVADVNHDGLADLVLLARESENAREGELVWLEAPNWRQHGIDTGAQFTDCLEAELGGVRGVLVLHRHGQLRFYTPPGRAGGDWTYREIYSIYTSSRQGGILRDDLDEDGDLDILFGNYWLRNSADSSPAWTLHAINLWQEDSYSAMTALARLPGEEVFQIVASQRDAANARVAVFSRPEDPARLWPGLSLEGRLKLRYPRAVAATEFGILVGEDAGKGSRLIHFEPLGDWYRARQVDETGGLLGLWNAGVDSGGALGLAGAGRKAVYWWRIQPLK